ncbi:hypothetical protein [Paenibacillus glycinis]|uniref:Uncharacterized protein n=1 Tax=Paenibacillus glycinis TaxID=2697035 RepID=A0ABW9XLK5_9BACL|nr:hypothetical protein [Paenibacillus glycinis]NBD23448.1 hypothetical protein [Paenibacillus glycinis]
MALNKNGKRNREDGQSGMKEYYVSLKPEKAANRPASLNGINKQLP